MEAKITLSLTRKEFNAIRDLVHMGVFEAVNKDEKELLESLDETMSSF